ncbi:Epoxyqueuosine reductase [Ewingella americana]|uniref:Epoxyqueuosine reductase n=1 Tax=Ewingella americana TaxID=41202 RepID=A0A377NI45_9GAMM|nr:Epoxyqueuosine reductase [Ewingella americana]
MDWMARHGMLRARPHELLPGTLRVISVRMNYLPAKAAFAKTLNNPELGYVSRYALGRDYHKVFAPTPEETGRKNPRLLHGTC